MNEFQKMSDLRFEPITSPFISEDAVACPYELPLPFFLWQNMNVTIEVREQLSPVERIILESGLRLDRFHANQITEITSIPEEAVHRVARRLSLKNALMVIPDRTYQINQQVAINCVNSESITIEKPSTYNFMYFPRTDDLIAFDNEEGKDEAEITKIRPIGRAPADEIHVGKPRYQFLEEMRNANCIENLPPEILEINPPDTLPPSLCDQFAPVYLANGVVYNHNDSYKFFLSIDGYQIGRKSATEITFDSKKIEFIGCMNLGDRLKDLSNYLDNPDYLKRAMENVFLMDFSDLSKICGVVEKTGNIRTVSLDQPSTKAIYSRGFSLLNDYGLIISEDELKVCVCLRFKPANADSENWFFVDEIVQKIIQTSNPNLDLINGLIRDISSNRKNDFGEIITSDFIINRLWDLMQFSSIYSIRSQRDFNYE